jgi:hypothetical protein
MINKKNCNWLILIEEINEMVECPCDNTHHGMCLKHWDISCKTDLMSCKEKYPTMKEFLIKYPNYKKI